GESVSYYGGGDWLGLNQATGQSSQSTSAGSSAVHSSGSSFSESESESDTSSESYTESESVADIPIFIPVPFQELSSVQYFSLEEQLHQVTAALKEQFPRHCFIRIQGQETQPLLVPLVPDFYLNEESFQWYRDRKLEEQDSLPAAEVD